MGRNLDTHPLPRAGDVPGEHAQRSSASDTWGAGWHPSPTLCPHVSFVFLPTPTRPHWPEHRHVGLDTFNGRMPRTRRPFPGWEEQQERVSSRTPTYDHPSPTALPFRKPNSWSPPFLGPHPPAPQVLNSRSDRCKRMHTTVWAPVHQRGHAERGPGVCGDPPVPTR